jgi:hypothetical protein
MGTRDDRIPEAGGLRRVLLICPDAVGDHMASPGIRHWEFARVLSNFSNVTLALAPSVKMYQTPAQPDFPAKVVLCRRAADLRALVAEADVIVTQGLTPTHYPFLLHTGKPLVVDLYDPFVLEFLHWFTDKPMPERVHFDEGQRRALVQQIWAADFMLCASEKQRDYWLGMLSALGRINAYTHSDDETMYRLIDVVPFGLPTVPPSHDKQVLKGVYKTIAGDDKVILWGGGIWDWFDAPTLVRAMERVSQERPNVKLFFMGTQRPNVIPPKSKMQAIDDTIALSKDLGLYDRYVFFNDWVLYNERQNY